MRYPYCLQKNIIEANGYGDKYGDILIGITRMVRVRRQIREDILGSSKKRYVVSENDLLAFMPGKAQENIVFVSDTKKRIAPVWYSLFSTANGRGWQLFRVC
jgi:hypothetical protein